jgi:hypothetical protein
MVKRAGENDLGLHKMSFLNKKTAVEKESMAVNGSWSLPVGRLNLKYCGAFVKESKSHGA